MPTLYLQKLKKKKPSLHVDQDTNIQIGIHTSQSL